MDPNTDTGKGLPNKNVFIHTSEREAQIYQALLPRMDLPESHNAQRLIMIHTSYGG